MKPTDPTPPRASSRPDHHAHDRHHAQHGHGAHDGLYNEDVAHEEADVNVRGLLIFCLGLVVVTIVTLAAMYGLLRVFEAQAVKNDPVVTPLAVPAGQPPPEPRLLENEPANLQTIKAQEREVLDGYGWTDQAAGAARIPIEEAKKKLLQQGLPVRAEGAVEPWMGTDAATRGESSGGRGIVLRPGQAGTQEPAPPAATAPAEKPAEHKSGGHQ